MGNASASSVPAPRESTFLKTEVPLWVAPLFIGLLFLGLRATKQRKIPLAISYSPPLLALISLQSLAQLPDQLFVWSAYALAYMGGLTIG